jgi:hypothetical protein
MKDAYNYGWVQSTSWTEWMQTKNALRLSRDPDRMAVATIDDLANVLTVSLRRDRFMEGSLAGDFKSGLIVRIVARANKLFLLQEAILGLEEHVITMETQA